MTADQVTEMLRISLIINLLKEIRSEHSPTSTANHAAMVALYAVDNLREELGVRFQ